MCDAMSLRVIHKTAQNQLMSYISCSSILVGFSGCICVACSCYA
ncbi:hypothetical protein HMPREF3214_00166 [Alloscardovia omnicolens]|nr:hypothetical protein HMPREF3214_00166 [Alloscardovia omnicolens]